ncbi:transporter substrate-binding domain-containing protein [Spirulina sp. 06S082]|uniref:transporter substrate-binding domain-containing protein n=1 Tax=Spirulina sp. 06S082 TaxID=3110248 RepID=UPI002B1FC3AF|nr:transporter substrate-binding domain-containing protein [Spirulina sp. 06S082]MEA5471623.1 transporter substrate-binding domain-containing protein [Spirulina sp. 06S082]
MASMMQIIELLLPRILKKVNSRQKRKKTGIFKSLLLIFGCWLLTVEGISAAELAEILERGQLIVGVKDNLRPLGFRDGEGNLQGLEIDIARKLAEELFGDRNAIILQPVTNAERLNAAIAQEVDLTIARVGVNSSRSRLINFSRYYYFDSTGFITREANINSRIDLKYRKVAVLERSSTIAIVRHAIPEVQLMGVKSYQEALTLLEAGEIAAFAGDRSLLTGWVQEYPQYRVLRDRLGGIPLAIVVPKGLKHSELYLYVNDAIARWQDSGWLQDRINYWGLGNFPEGEENGQ